MNEIDRQREYYAKTAGIYDEGHLSGADSEHDIALSVLTGLSHYYNLKNFLDVGSGTGRGLSYISKHLPTAKILGIEPVEALREIGYKKGISKDQLIDGDATSLLLETNSFDCVFASGIMHHIPNPRKALQEMIRVSKKAIFISDLNNFGCGSILQKMLSHALNFLHLWTFFQFLKNGLKNYKYNDGDGIHYSYSLLTEVEFFKKQGFSVFLFTTRPTSKNPFWSCSHVALLVIKP